MDRDYNLEKRLEDKEITPEIFLDSCAFIRAYQMLGTNFFKEMESNEVRYVTTWDVIQELQKQHNEKRAEDGKFIVPWNLLGAVYDAVEKNSIDVKYPSVDEEDRERMRGELLKGSKDKKNQRLGNADMSLIKSASEVESALIVSNDSDLSNVIEGGEYRKLRVISPESYFVKEKDIIL